MSGPGDLPLDATRAGASRGPRRCGRGRWAWLALGLVAAGAAALYRTAQAPGEQAAAGAADTAREVQQWLRACRAAASLEQGGAPDWPRAEEACGRALDLEPLQAEAHALLRRIRPEREAQERFARGEQALARLDAEAALALFEGIPKDSGYFRRAGPRLREARAEVLRRARDDCERSMGARQWRAAVPRCERYLRLSCEGGAGSAGSAASGARQALPADPLARRFLTVRQRLAPRAGPWTCTPVEGSEGAPPGEDPREAVAAALRRRTPDRLLQAALLDYWGGRTTEALAGLQRLRADAARASLHAEAGALLRSVAAADQLFKRGEGLLQAGDPEAAAGPLREALELDAGLLGALASTHPSHFRRTLQQDMAQRAHAVGRYWAERQELRRGCRVWRLGFGFYAGDPELNRAVAECSTRGLARLQAARGCADLAGVLELAMEGDGLREQVDARRSAWACPVDRAGRAG